MKIGIIGGTGGMGKGFALRWSQNHNVIVGSRDAVRASESAKEYTNLAKESFGQINGTITGNDNVSVAKDSDVLILSIPYENIDSVCSEILPVVKDSCVVVSPIVPMIKTDVGFEFIPIKENKPLSGQIIYCPLYFEIKYRVLSIAFCLLEFPLSLINFTAIK